MTRGKKNGVAKAPEPQVTGDLAGMLGPLLDRVRQEAMEAARAEFKAELASARAVEPASVPPVRSIREEVSEPAGRRGPPRQPGSRYSEPGIRVRRGQIKVEDAGETKIWSAFMDPEVIAAFRRKAKEYGMTQRYAAEQAFMDWVKKAGVGRREIKEPR